MHAHPQIDAYITGYNTQVLSSDLATLITGSNTHAPSSDLATLLGGRYVEVPVHPLSFEEYLDFAWACGISQG